jgi:ammonia channel protein AmtB
MYVGFNPGSNLGVSTWALATSTARTAVVTTLGAGAGAISAMIFGWWRNRTWDLLVVSVVYV